MAKKILTVAFAVIVLCLCCGVCFAAEDTSVNLGNEVMQSIDKAGSSIQNVVSGNVVRDTGNMVKDAGENVKDGVNNMGNDGKNVVDGVVNKTETGNYNVTRTETAGTVSRMTTTTWMWIILVVAAIIIIAAIWYYATKSND